MFDCWRFILCKKTGSSHCSSPSIQTNEVKEEETEHQIDVSDVICLVHDKQQVTPLATNIIRYWGK
uniref:Uncharacterized protein n=1 Tax=Sarcophilus harrisii TaxID=9305 RepID=A0A7N4PF48_SARHA